MTLTLVFLGAAVALLLARNADKLIRLKNVNSLFREDLIVSNFRNLHAIGFDTVNVSTRGAPVAALETVSDALTLPESFTWNGTRFNTEQWLEDHWTTGSEEREKERERGAINL